jgi:hypothetical protein
MKITRRSLIVAPAALVVAPATLIVAPARAGVLLALGEFIVELFETVVEVGINMLIESAAKYLWSHFLGPERSQTQFVQAARPYVEGGHAADNFCAYCTVEYQKRGVRFWNGTLFDPNEDNTFYRTFRKPTDQVLLEMTTDSEWLPFLDVGKNQNAHIPTAALDEIRQRVRHLESDKARLYYQIDKRTLSGDDLEQYLIPRPALREIDRAYRHVTTEYHINQKYVESVVQLQKFATWFNTKLLGLQVATTKGELIALRRHGRRSPEDRAGKA